MPIIISNPEKTLGLAMATNDYRRSRTKHRRNSDYEPQKSSKRHKHHRSTCNVVTACANKTQAIPPRTSSTTCVIVSNGVWQPDHDMEQGEILDIGVDNYMNFKRSDHIKEEKNGKVGSGRMVSADQILETFECYREKCWEERDREGEKERSSRGKERRDRERPRDGERDGYREQKGARNSHHRKYQDLNNIGDLDKHNDHIHQRSVDKDYKQRSRTNDKEQIDSYETVNSEVDAQRLCRDEVEQEDHPEMVMHIAEQEEEDLNRIKEESRLRRQAILEKYKAQQSQPKHELKSEETVKESYKQPSKATGEAHSSQNESVDMFLDDISFSLSKSPEQTETPQRSGDMVCDDIFGDSPAGVCKQGKGAGLKIERLDPQDNWDDAQGYYMYNSEEVLDGRYKVIARHGEGVFSKVVCAKDLKAGSGDPEMVAIKIIRSNDTLCKAGLDELVILNKLIGADPEDRRHCVRYLSTFKYKNHLCLVFESLDMDLRQALIKFGHGVGLDLKAVRMYAKQLFIALKHMKNCGVLHSDIKPDNMLARTVLKLSDFGSAMFAGKNEITPYLVSRFYRAPEIILGLSYGHPIDIWSVGCCLYEFYTGKFLFPGPSNNDMLRLHMELKGLFPKKMLRKGAFTDQHFDRDLNFFGIEEDPFTKKAIKKLIPYFEPKDFSSILLRYADDDPKMFANFKDLLDKIFVLNPDKRIAVSQALSQPFITGK